MIISNVCPQMGMPGYSVSFLFLAFGIPSKHFKLASLGLVHLVAFELSNLWRSSFTHQLLYSCVSKVGGFGAVWVFGHLGRFFFCFWSFRELSNFEICFASFVLILKKSSFFLFQCC